MSKISCNVCHHHCIISEGKIGLCNASMNQYDKIIPINYGKVTSIALDPIEKKPLQRFYPGSKILSVGSFGCNLRCQYCQNHSISMAKSENTDTAFISPTELINTALELIPNGNIGIAYTYNEPLIGYEYVRDCAKLAQENNLKNVVVTNGCFTENTLEELLPYVDAMNIDLKGFTDSFYSNIEGDLETVKNFIRLVAKHCHIEITTLIIPEENDSEEDIRRLSEFISSNNPEIPLHLSRFFPNYKMTDKSPTKVSTVYHLADIAREKLKFVYEGNC